MDYRLKKAPTRRSTRRVILATFESCPLWKSQVKKTESLQKESQPTTWSVMAVVKHVFDMSRVRGHQDACKGTTIKHLKEENLKLKESTMLRLTITALINPPISIRTQDTSNSRYPVMVLLSALSTSAVADSRKDNHGSSCRSRCAAIQKPM